MCVLRNATAVILKEIYGYVVGVITMITKSYHKVKRDIFIAF